MNNPNLDLKLLDTAIKTMERNRSLLFAINLIAALVVVVVFLEKYSFDNQQREGHLIAFEGRCLSLNDSMRKIPNWENILDVKKEGLNACSDLNEINKFVVANSDCYPSEEAKERTLKEIGKSIFKLHIIKNEMKTTRLDVASVAPLGFGIPVPRNDLVMICGILLVVLSMWLAFSFDQHVRITKKIRILFPKKKRNKNTKDQADIDDLIELNFLFPTSEGGMKALFIKTLYVIAPIAMSIAAINDFYLDAQTGYMTYLNDILLIPRIIEVLIVLILWRISLHILTSDEKAN